MVRLQLPFRGILGYIFYPVAWVNGRTVSESAAGRYHGVETGFQQIRGDDGSAENRASTLSPRAEGIISVFTVSFANFSSIGIIIAGAIKGLNEGQGNVVFRFGLKLVLRFCAGGRTVASIADAGAVSLGLMQKPGLSPVFIPLICLAGAG
ncbi:hypothetical protein KCP74_13195 [Salmonella enterica subsp. enterica]|nr:hypothetical protein KCP74_13195 [Salmonella enterica subsp. enterica]